MRFIPCLLGLFVVALPVPTGGAHPYSNDTPASGRPLRVMSLNQCSDQLVLALLPPEQITSVTWLSRNAHSSLMHKQAMGVAVNHGLAEEVARQKPDLVIAGTYTTPATRGLLKRLGFPLLELDHADSFDDIRRITRTLAKATNSVARGEALIDEMDKQITALKRDPAPAIAVAAWDSAGLSAKPGSLYDEILSLAGAINIASHPPANQYNRPDTEVLLLTAPALLIKGNDNQARSLNNNIENHPIVRRTWTKARTLSLSPAAYMCGTPMAANAAKQLRDALRAVQKTDLTSKQSIKRTSHAGYSQQPVVQPVLVSAPVPIPVPVPVPVPAPASLSSGTAPSIGANISLPSGSGSAMLAVREIEASASVSALALLPKGQLTLAYTPDFRPRNKVIHP